MKNNIQNPTVNGIVAVVVGILAGILTFFIGWFFLSLFENVTQKHEAGVIDNTITTPLLIAPILASLVAGFIVARISIQRAIIYSIIAGIGLVIFWMLCFYSPSESSSKTGVYLIIPLVIIGGWLGVLYKGRKKQSP